MSAKDSATLLMVLLLAGQSSATVCPTSCVCTTTPDGLHKATCSNVAELYKFTIKHRHHNINILDLSHNNITKLTNELDRLTEVVTLDLSTNGVTEVDKFLHNAKKIVHLNLANNRIRGIDLSHLPTSISSLDLSNNLLYDVPSNLQHLNSLEHLEMEGNPIDCSCDNIKSRDYLVAKKVLIDDVICKSPYILRGRSWLEIKVKDVCKSNKISLNNDYLDMMMGDQPADAVSIGKETTELKSLPKQASSDLEEGQVWLGAPSPKDDDEIAFLKASSVSSSNLNEGSGDSLNTTPDDTLTESSNNLQHNELANEEIIPADIMTTEDPFEGSGDDGSGFFQFDDFLKATTEFVPIYTGRVHTVFSYDTINNDTTTTTEYLHQKKIKGVFMGGDDWINNTESPVTEQLTTTQHTRDTTISEQIVVTHSSVELNQDASGTNDKLTTHKTGTYVCIAIIAILLVGLIGFAIVKGQIRRRRDRRLLRQQKQDIEKGSKELVDMNKSLLGKPAVEKQAIERKSNGKYEAVPTHETALKRNENGDISNGLSHTDRNENKRDDTRNVGQSKISPRDNNQNREKNRLPLTKQGNIISSLTSPDSKRDSNSLSSDDIFIPSNENNPPRVNGVPESEASQPLINGDQTADSDFLSPSREYVPVYSPDMGRVRIKITETAKPTTPVFVTRSRSNAGDIIITPTDANLRKSTT